MFKIAINDAFMYYSFDTMPRVKINVVHQKEWLVFIKQDNHPRG